MLSVADNHKSEASSIRTNTSACSPKLDLAGTSVVLAHDVDDFSRIWQAMGRSRTMNTTRFTRMLYTGGP